MARIGVGSQLRAGRPAVAVVPSIARSFIRVAGQPSVQLQQCSQCPPYLLSLSANVLAKHARLPYTPYSVYTHTYFGCNYKCFVRLRSPLTVGG